MNQTPLDRLPHPWLEGPARDKIDPQSQGLLEVTGKLNESKTNGGIRVVLAEEYSRDREELSRVAVLLAEIGEVVKPRFRLSVLPDGPDNRILEAAVAGRAAAVVTGDKALPALEAYRGIRILTLARYLD